MVLPEETSCEAISSIWYCIEIPKFNVFWMNRFNHLMILQYITQQINSNPNYNLFLDHYVWNSYYESPINYINLNGEKLVQNCKHIINQYLNPLLSINKIDNINIRFNRSSIKNFNIFLDKNCVLNLISDSKFILQLLRFAVQQISKYMYRLKLMKKTYIANSMKHKYIAKYRINMILLEKI